MKERRVRAGREPRLFIEEGEDTEFAFDDVDTRLVVGELDECPVNLIADVFVLLELEDVRVELIRVRKPSAQCRVEAYLLLQLLVRVVDTELLEAVALEVLETVDTEV